MVTICRINGPAIGGIFEDLVNLYELVYREPPYEEGPEQVSRFRASLGEEATRPGFTLLTASDDGLLVGAVYGWTMAAGEWWSRSDVEPDAAIKNVDKFAVMEWIVHPSRRGEGIGSKLIRKLLAERPEEIATLASDPRSSARAMYSRAGWIQVARSSLSWGPEMDLLILRK